jgi:multiple sugar transport system ATP-binding protein
VGIPTDIYDRPATMFVAQLVGSPKINLVRASCDGQNLVLDGSGYRVPVENVCENGAAALPESFTLGVRPEDVQLTPKGAFAGTIMLVEPLGVETLLHIKVDGQVIICTVPGIASAKLGDDVHFDIARERLHLFHPVTGARLNA